MPAMENITVNRDDKYLPINYIQNSSSVHSLAESLIIYKIGKHQKFNWNTTFKVFEYWSVKPKF